MAKNNNLKKINRKWKVISMHFEQFGARIYLPGDEDKYKKKRGVNALAPKRITKNDMLKWLKTAAIDEETKEELVKKVNSYPGNTMHHFFDNLHKHISRLHKKRKNDDS